MSNINLSLAKVKQNDEFYTQYIDIELELTYYIQYFKDKIIYCNCDNPSFSNFWRYFHLNFQKLKLRKLIATYYDNNKRVFKYEYNGGSDKNIDSADKKELTLNGDFRSDECIEILKQADIVVTNPPFSLFREYVAQLFEYNKQFLILGSINAISYKDFFPFIKNDRVWMGYSYPKEFLDLKGNLKKFGNICWWTNLPTIKRNEQLNLTKSILSNKYEKYDNFNAINVDKVSDIPYDYDGVMGVPISFISKHNPNQFEIVALGTAPTFFTPTILYKNILRHNKDGTTTNKHICCNQVLTIAHSTKPDGIYFTADNTNKYLTTPYKRILIKNKKKIN